MEEHNVLELIALTLEPWSSLLWYASKHTSILRTHLKTHTGEKSFKCSHCNFVSSGTSVLNKHLITHSDQERNKCNQCEYAFSQAQILYSSCKQTWQIVKTFLFSTFYLVNLERSGLPPVWIWNRHPHPLIYVWGIKIQSLTHKSEAEDVCFYIGLRAAKITLWAFEGKSHLGASTWTKFDEFSETSKRPLTLSPPPAPPPTLVSENNVALF